MHREQIMHFTAITLVIGGSLIASAGCATKSGTGTAVGAVGGAAVGGLVGGETGALIGAALGGLLGYEAGRAIEEEDRRRVAAALEQDRAMRWQNQHTGRYYEVQPVNTFYQSGRECREFRMVAEVGEDLEEVHGTACRQPGGSWEILSG
jgi:surface antigen